MGTARARRLRIVLASAAVVAVSAIGVEAMPLRAAVLGDPPTSVGGVMLASAGPRTPAVELASAAGAGTTAADRAGFWLAHADRTGPAPAALVDVERAMPITSRPGGGRALGAMPAGSRFYGTPTVAWIRRISSDGRFGLVDVPYAATPASGWIALRGLDRSTTRIRVVADLSAHRIAVLRGAEVLFRTPAATGAPASPTPLGRYFVTDRVPFPAGSSLGTFAFGLSGIQPRLPAGWSGGDQLAIHGTNDPSSIGRSASAGCLRVSETALARLRPLLRLGTPVIVRA